MSTKPALTGETLASLSEHLAQLREPAYRAPQILEWLYKKRVRSWDQMTNLPKSLRQQLDSVFTLNPATLLLDKQSSDTTQKLLLQLDDDALIETVIIRAPQKAVGLDDSRNTLCISTQVGCAMACAFCASGLEGLQRNLSAGEIVAQFLHACHVEDTLNPPATAPSNTPVTPFDNLVVMGMGEPLANYDALVRALTIINAPWGLNFGARRITVSTSGLVPKILQLAEEPIAVRLAVSLHAATNEIRDQIMPVNKAYPLEKLIPAIEAFSEKHGRMVTLEYILIDNLNDSPDQARHLVDIARQLHAHVNLIPCNPVDSLPYKRPSPERQQQFQKILDEARVSNTLRREKGQEIDAACGQLRLKTQQSLQQ